MGHIQTEKIVVFWGSDTRPKLAKLPHAVKPKGQQIKSKVTVGVLWDVVSVLSVQDSSKFQVYQVAIFKT